MNTEKPTKTQVLGPQGSIGGELVRSPYADPGEEFEVLRLVRRGCAIRLVRTEDLRLVYSHFNAGVGTRSLSINLPEIEPKGKPWALMSWSIDLITFALSWRDERGEEISHLIGSPFLAPFRLHISDINDIIVIGSSGVEVSDVLMWVDDEIYVEPTAIEYWDRTKNLVSQLILAYDPAHHLRGVACSNAAISALISGMEIYVRLRLMEIERDGVKPDIQRFLKKEFASDEFSILLQRITTEAKSKGVDPLKFYIRTRRLSAHGYDRIKDLFNWIYGMSIASIGIESKDIDLARAVVSHRHHITHVDPCLPVVFRPRSKWPLGPADDKFVESALKALDTIISQIHEATLRVKPAPGSAVN